VSEESSPVEGGPPVRIVMADDHPLMRAALRELLETQPDFEVVGEAADGRQALDLCRSLRPALALLDLRIPEIDGVAATRTIKQELPGIVVLVITAIEDPNYLSKALKAGAAGYVLKDATRQEILNAIRKVLAGKSTLESGIAMELLRQLLAEERPPKPLEEQPPRSSQLGGLTRREVEVLRLIATGRTNQQIARSLLVSVSTVKTHVHTIISKLGVSDRVQAAVKAIELGLLDDQDG
jgi:NarL family two-component system response regulator LiaR